MKVAVKGKSVDSDEEQSSEEEQTPRKVTKEKGKEKERVSVLIS